ncbi:MAG: hypothetical protein WBG17_11460 [Burkholderiaceae bacterium]
MDRIVTRGDCRRRPGFPAVAAMRIVPEHQESGAAAVTVPAVAGKAYSLCITRIGAMGVCINFFVNTPGLSRVFREYVSARHRHPVFCFFHLHSTP